MHCSTCAVAIVAERAHELHSQTGLVQQIQTFYAGRKALQNGATITARHSLVLLPSEFVVSQQMCAFVTMLFSADSGVLLQSVA